VGLLESLGLKKPPPSDPVFYFKKFYSFAQPYWEAEAEFSPTGSSVEVLIECPRSGADPGQHAFFRDLETRYADVLSAACSAISAEFPRETYDFTAPSSGVLRLACISLPPTPPTGEWELSFEDAGCVHYTVAFRGWSPIRVEIEPC
jgi:hypothetical protein